jgi:hypothetical protein
MNNLTNIQAIEKLSTSFMKFLDKAQIKNTDYKQLALLTSNEKLFFISKYLKPHKNNLDELIIETIEKKGDKLENYKSEDIEKFKKYLCAFIECI